MPPQLGALQRLWEARGREQALIAGGQAPRPPGNPHAIPTRCPSETLGGQGEGEGFDSRWMSPPPSREPPRCPN